MTEVVEGEVGYSRPFPRPVPSITKGTSVKGRAFLLSRCSDSNLKLLHHSMAPTSTNHSLSRAETLSFWSRSICSQRNPSISPRLIAVSMAKLINRPEIPRSDFSAATLSLIELSVFHRFSLVGLFFGILIRLVDSSGNARPVQFGLCSKHGEAGQGHTDRL